MLNVYVAMQNEFQRLKPQSSRSGELSNCAETYLAHFVLFLVVVVVLYLQFLLNKFRIDVCNFFFFIFVFLSS